MGPLIGLDANIFIYTLEAHVTYGPAAAQLLKAVANGMVKATASELIYLEVLAGKNVKTAAQEGRASAFLAGLGIVYKGIDRQLLIAAAKLRRDFRIKTPDAIHVASAMAVGATQFVTNDQELIKKAVKGIAILSLDEAIAAIKE